MIGSGIPRDCLPSSRRTLREAGAAALKLFSKHKPQRRFSEALVIVEVSVFRQCNFLLSNEKILENIPNWNLRLLYATMSVSTIFFCRWEVDTKFHTGNVSPPVLTLSCTQSGLGKCLLIQVRTAQPFRWWRFSAGEHALALVKLPGHMKPLILMNP